MVQISWRADGCWYRCRDRERKITRSQAWRLWCALLADGRETEIAVRDRRTGMTIRME